MKNILVPLGVSENAESTLTYAIELVKVTHMTLYVMDSFNPSFHNAHLLNAKQAVGNSNTKRIKELVQRIDNKNIDIQIVQYEGDVLSAIASLNQK